MERVYKFQNVEIGVLNEIMLPKKIQYQGFLFESLIKGIKDFSFSKYYDENKEMVDKLLEKYCSLHNLTDEKLKGFEKKFKDIFKGYSMYEVDGVFKFSDTDVQGIALAEERTQIIKVYFIPEYRQILNEINGIQSNRNEVSMEAILNFADLFFSMSKVTSYESENISRRLSPFIDDVKEINALGFDNEAQIRFLLNYLKDWVDAAGFFVFGFMVNEICRCIKQMHRKEEIKHMEEEIWVSSQWGILINKTILM